MTYVDHFNFQFAGEVGFLSAGLGKKFGKYTVGGMYGLVPQGMSGTNNIETVTIRQTYHFYDWKRFNFYGGLNIFHVLGVSYESSRYGKSPKSYYAIGSIRGLLNLGFSFQLDRQESEFFYFEGGMNDMWIENTLANSDTVNPTDHVSLALGYLKRF